MKTILKLSLIAIAMICASDLMAQEGLDVTKPKYVVGGSFALFSSNSSSQSINESLRISIDSYVGRQVSDRWLIGINVGWDHDDDNIGTLGPTNRYDFGVFGRYSFMPNSRYDIFLQPSVDLRLNRGETFLSNSEDLLIWIRPGASFQLSNKVRLLGYVGGLRYMKELGEDYSQFFAGISLRNLNIGAEIGF